MSAAKAFEIARINLLRQVRDRTDVFFVFVLPTIIIFALGLQFGGMTSARLGIVAPAGDVVADALVEELAAAPIRLEIRRIADEETLRTQVERGLLEAGLVVPDDIAAAVRGSEPVEVQYLGTTDSLTLGLRAPVEAAIARVAAVATAARVAVAAGAGDWDAASREAEDRFGDMPGVELDVSIVGEAGLFAGFSQFTFGASTQLVLFMFLTSMTAAGRLVYTKQLGVSRRMVSTPTTMGTIVTGEALGRFGVALLQAAFIVAVTAIAFNVSWGDPLAAGALIVVFGVVSAAVAMLIGAIARNPDQASSVGIFLGIALAALGGCMIPIQTMPEAMQQLSRFIPHSWALLGLQSLIRDGGGIDTVAVNLAVLTGFAVVLMGLAVWRFRKAIAG